MLAVSGAAIETRHPPIGSKGQLSYLYVNITFNLKAYDITVIHPVIHRQEHALE